MGDQQQALGVAVVGGSGVEVDGVHSVQQALLGADEQLGLCLRVGDIQDPGLVVLGVPGEDQQLLLVRGELDAGPEFAVGDLQQESVLLGRGPEGVHVQPVGPPGGVGHHVVGALAGGLHDRAAVDVLHRLRQVLSGAQVSEAQRVVLISGGVLAVGQQAPGVGPRHPAQLIEGVGLGLGIGVEIGDLALQRHTGLDLGRSPGRGILGVALRGDAAVDGVLLALDGAGEVPPVAAARGYGEVRLHGAVLDLVEDRVSQRLLIGGDSLGVRVLRMQVVQDLL